jgi:heme exporter protein D
MNTAIKCPACAYKAGVSKETMVAVALLGETGNVVTDAVAIGVGVGLAIAALTVRQRRRVLGGFCQTHKRDIKIASESFK